MDKRVDKKAKHIFKGGYFHPLKKCSYLEYIYNVH